MKPIFTNNKNSTLGQNSFNINNRPGVNLFTYNKTQNQNQNIQNQPLLMPNQWRSPDCKPTRQNTCIQECLQQKHSFITILQKCTLNQEFTFSKALQRQKLSTGQLNFVTKMGLLIFETDELKKYHFLNVKSKEPHLGYGPEVMVYKGQMQKSDLINQIWTKLVEDFSQICETNEMNGYFLLKKILCDGRYYQKIYRPKQGLSNKVFEPNFEYLKSFFINSETSGNPYILNVNVSGEIYVEILTKMVENYQIEWLSFFQIIEKVGQGKQFRSQDKNYVRLSGYKKGSIQKQPGTQPLTLNFQVLHEENIMDELWKAYKKFSLSEAKQPAAQNLKIDIPKKKWTDIKRILFTKVGNLIKKLLNVQYTQEMLMKNQPIPLFDAIQFVKKDIEKVHIENLIEPQIENFYIESGLNLILALIPFASYIQHDDNEKDDDYKVITSYLNFSSQENRLINARQVINRKELLHHLSKFKINEFEPLVIWAKLELKRIQIITGPFNILEAQREKRKQEAVETWEKYFQKSTANYNIFEEDKWKHWVGLFVENLSIDAIIQSTILRNHFVYYCKRVVKDRRAEFFRLWESILEFKYSGEQRDIESRLKNLHINPTTEDRKSIQFLPSKILRNYDLYTVGRFLRKINRKKYLTQALNVFTTLIKRRKDQDGIVNYTKKLLFFLRNNLEIPQEKDFTTNLFEIVLQALSKKFSISCKTKSLSNDVYDQQKIQKLKMEQTIYSFMQPVDYKVKFLCELVIQNMYSFEFLQGYIFDSEKVLSITNDFPGIRMCIFLCKILQKIIPNTTSNIKSIRYLIKAIDCLFTYKQTQEIIICALSIVFPYDFTPKNQINLITRTTERFMSQKPVRRCAWSILEFIQLKHDSNAQNLKHVQKLRKTISYHFNHMVKSCDSVEQYFIINKDQDQAETYKKIEEQTRKWKFTSVFSLLNSPNKRFRASDWFYTIARVMQSNNLLPIDIDSIIESLRKMRVPNNGNYVSFEPMRILFEIINQGTVLDQMFKFLKPTGYEHKETALIENQKMAFYKPMEILLQIPDGTRYNKYQNKTIVKQKTARLAMDEQHQLLRTICMYARLIEEILRLYLDLQRFESYQLIKNLTLVKQLIPKLTIHQHIHQFRAVSRDQVESETKMNIIASLVALLNLYTYKCKFPGMISYVKQESRSMLQILEESSTNNIGEEGKWFGARFKKPTWDENIDIYEFYRNQFQNDNPKYFESVLYQMTDFSFENDETSLRATIFSILQLLFENKCSKTVIQAISNYSQSIICSGNVSNQSLTNNQLFSNDHKNLTPLLFSHINHLLTLSSSPNTTLRKRLNLPHIVRTIQVLSVLVFETSLANQVISSLQKISRCFVELITITSEEIQNANFCSKAQQINIINRISMFTQRIIVKAKNILSEDEFQKNIIQNFLINPQNILKLLFERMTQLSKDFKIDKFSLIQTATDQVANYVMQVNLTRNALYRASYDMMIQIVFQVLQYLNKDQVAQIVSYLLFKNYELVTTKPKELKFLPEIIIKINLQPLETIKIAQVNDKTILTTDLSLKVTNFVYCSRMNLRKYGPNFMYDTNLAFHIIKAENQKDVPNAEERLINVRKQVFLIQLVNCMKSLSFSFQSMVKSYFQLMFLLTITGPIDQNLQIFERDSNLPKAYESAILQNKYCLRNQFSFVQSLQIIKKDILMGNEQLIVSKIVNIMEEFLTFVQVKPQNFNESTKEIAIKKTEIIGIPRNAIFVDRVFLETSVGDCLNRSHVIMVLRNISNALIDHLTQQQDLKSTAHKQIQFLQNFFHIMTNFPLSLIMLQQTFISIFVQYRKNIQISTKAISSEQECRDRPKNQSESRKEQQQQRQDQSGQQTQEQCQQQQGSKQGWTNRKFQRNIFKKPLGKFQKLMKNILAQKNNESKHFTEIRGGNRNLSTFPKYWVLCDKLGCKDQLKQKFKQWIKNDLKYERYKMSQQEYNELVQSYNRIKNSLECTDLEEAVRVYWGDFKYQKRFEDSLQEVKAFKQKISIQI